MDQRINLTVMTLGFVIAFACAVMYFMKLSIFSSATIQWFFVAGLVSFCIGTISGILKAVWSQPESAFE